MNRSALIAVLLALSLTACGNKPAEEPVTSAPVAAPAAEAVSAVPAAPAAMESEKK